MLFHEVAVTKFVADVADVADVAVVANVARVFDRKRKWGKETSCC